MSTKEDLASLLTLLDASSSETVNTSIRIPGKLSEATKLAQELGLQETQTELSVAGLRTKLEVFANQLLLENHYQEHPNSRPSLKDLALAEAELQDESVADEPQLIDQAITLRPDATPEEVVAIAIGLAARKAAA